MGIPHEAGWLSRRSFSVSSNYNLSERRRHPNSPPNLSVANRPWPPASSTKRQRFTAISARALPTDAGILMNLGMAQSMAGRPRDAVESLERAVQLEPSLHPAWLFLGTAYLEVGDAASAIRPLVKAVDTDPSSPKARRMLADAYLTLERFDEADRHLRKLTALDRNDAAGRVRARPEPRSTRAPRLRSTAAVGAGIRVRNVPDGRGADR